MDVSDVTFQTVEQDHNDDASTRRTKEIQRPVKTGQKKQKSSGTQLNGTHFSR